MSDKEQEDFQRHMELVETLGHAGFVFDGNEETGHIVLESDPNRVVMTNGEYFSILEGRSVKGLMAELCRRVE